MSWRVVIATRILPVALGFDAAVRAAGHEPVALLTIRDPERRYGDWDLASLVDDAPAGLDLLIAARRSSLAQLLASARPDLVVCMGFPWKVPVDALAVPALGWLNGHPSLLPQHRGPIPLSWAIRHGDEEVGVSIHFMDAELDTGPVVAQRRFPLGEPVEPDAFYAAMGPIVVEALVEALVKVEAGDRGMPQAGGTYETFFTADDVWLDPSRSADEVRRLAWAWRYTPPIGVAEQGLLVDLDGETVRVLETSLTEVDGAARVDCADAPLWLVRTEPRAARAEARPAGSPAPTAAGR
jgi:methionyl-tRNA formyltransferase